MVSAAQALRAWRHLLYPGWRLHRAFPRATLQRIEEAVQASERQHRAELRFVVEGGLDFIAAWRGLTPRERAIEIFSNLRVWDTEENCGVLIYVQLVDRDIEIIADRSVDAKVAQAEWEAVCRGMESAFRDDRFVDGALQGIAEVTALIARHFPALAVNRNELSDRPLILPGGG